jgi:predicted ATPase
LERYTSAVALICSSEGPNQRFGNSFVVSQGPGYDLALTCSHVIDDLGGDASLAARGTEASVVMRAREPVDLALIQLTAEADARILRAAPKVTVRQRVTVVGYLSHASGFVLRRLDATVCAATSLMARSSARATPAWEILIDGGEALEPGLSGSPVLNRVGEVVGVVLSRGASGSRGLMVDVPRLGDSWPELLARLGDDWGSHPDEQRGCLDSRRGAEVRTFFVGRNEELETLMRRMRSSYASSGSLAFVVGGPGTGKSALATELMAKAAESYPQLAISLARTDPLAGRHVSYGLFKTILERVLEWSASTSDGEALLDAMAEALANMGIQNLGPWPAFAGAQTRRLASRLQDIVSRDGLPSFRLDHLLDQSAILESYAAVLFAVSARVPILAVMEDIHWADESSILLLTHVAREIENSRIMIVCTLRREDLEENQLAREAYDRLRAIGAADLDLDLASLPITERKVQHAEFCHEFIAARYGQDIADRLSPSLAEVCGSSALFLTEILFDLENKGILERTADKWELTRETRLEDLPRRLEQLLRQRVSRLDGSLLEILRYGAVEGESFTAEVVARISSTTDAQVLALVSEKLMRVHRIVVHGGERRLANGSYLHSYQFDHALTRRFVYRYLLSDDERRQIHAEIARCLEEVWIDSTEYVLPQLATHFSLAGESRQAAEYALSAAKSLRRECAWSELTKFARMGLEAALSASQWVGPEKDKEIRELTYLSALGESEGGIRSEAIDHIQEGLRVLRPLLIDRDQHDLAEQGRLYLLEAKLQASLGVDSTPNELLTLAADCFEAVGDDEGLVQALSVQVYDTNVLADQEAAGEELARRIRCLEIAQRLNNLPLIVKAMGDLAVHHLNFRVPTENQLERAEALAAEARERAQTLSPSQRADAELVCSWVMHHRGRFGPALLRQREHVLHMAKLGRQSILEAEALTDIAHYQSLVVDGLNVAEQSLRIALKNRQSLGRHAVHDRESLAAFLFRRGRISEAVCLLQKSIPEEGGDRLARLKCQILWYKALLVGPHEAKGSGLTEPELFRLAGAGDVYGALAHLELGHDGLALELAKMAQRMADDSVARGVFHSYVDTHTVLGFVFERLGDEGRAEDEYQLAEAAWTDLSARTDVSNLVLYWQFRLLAARRLVAAGRFPSAHTALKEAADWLGRAGDWRSLEARLLLLRTEVSDPGSGESEEGLRRQVADLGVRYLIEMLP